MYYDIHTLFPVVHKDSVLHSWNYSKEEMLNPKDLAVYTFKYKTKRSKRVMIEPIEVSEIGFSVKSIDRAIEFQNSVGEELFYLLKYSVDKNENI